MSVTVCAICLEPLTTGGAVTPVHAACLGVDADLLALAHAVVAHDAVVWHPEQKRRAMTLYVPMVAKARAAIARAERATTSRGTARRGELTITDEPTGTLAPNQGDDHAE
jgi:hypothetical protein